MGVRRGIDMGKRFKQIWLWNDTVIKIDKRLEYLRNNAEAGRPRADFIDELIDVGLWFYGKRIVIVSKKERMERLAREAKWKRNVKRWGRPRKDISH